MMVWFDHCFLYNHFRLLWLLAFAVIWKENISKWLLFITHRHRPLHSYLDTDVGKIPKFAGSQKAYFQTSLSLKWLQILISFFHNLKIKYFRLHLALVSFKNLNFSLNASILKKRDQKMEFHSSAKMVNFQHFWECWKNAGLWETVV